MPSARVRLLLGGSLTGFVLLSLVVAAGWDPLLALDARVGAAARITPASPGWVREAWLATSLLTDTPAMTIYTVVIVLLLAWRARRRLALWVALVMISVGVGNALLKLLFGRARPTWDDPVTVVESHAFPSGHSSGIVAFAGVVLVLTTLLAPRLLPWAGAVAVLVVIAIGVDRLALGVHHLSDVIAGFLFGLVVVSGWLLLFSPRPREAVTRDGAARGILPG